MCKLGIPQNDWKRSDAIPYCEGELSSLRCSRWDSRLSVIWNCFQPTSINSFMCDGKHKGITMKHMIPNVSEWERKKKMAPESQSYKPPSRNFHSRTELNFKWISCAFLVSLCIKWYSAAICKREINIVILCSFVPSLYHWLQSRENKEI